MHEDEPLQRAMDAENGKLVEAAMEHLSNAQRRALHLAYFEGLTHTEVARRLDIPLGSAKTNIRQGLIKLRKILHQMDSDWMKP